MAQYAYYDSSVPEPSPVIGWYDTDEFTYPSMPAAVDLLQLTAAEWQEHFNSQGWAVSGGQLVAYTPPPPTLTLPQQAQAAFGKGVTLTSASTPAVDALYACDATAQQRVNNIVVYLTVNGVFPGGVNTIQWLDKKGAVHIFDAANFKAFATKFADYVAALDNVLLGLSTTLPAPSITIP